MEAHRINRLSIKYCFTSGTGELESERYYTEYDIEIWGECEDDDGNSESILVGKAKVELFLIGLAINNGFDLYDLFDSTQHGLDLGNCIVDWDKLEFKGDFEDLIADAANNNILYIDRIEILPEYRKHGFGKKVIKDIVYRFDQSCGLVMLKAFPLQLEGDKQVLGRDEEWYKRMKYDELISDEKTARRQLYKFYKSVGFTRYDKTDYFYLSSIMINKKLNLIDLDEYFNP